MKILISVFIWHIPFLIVGQNNKNAGPDFDMEDFNKKVAVAEWLCIYDNIAWWTSDSVMVQDENEINKLGNEWFCFQDSQNKWHAVYGKYENNIFELVFHFTVDSDAQVKRVYDQPNPDMLNKYARALVTANNQLTELRDSISISFNQYIKHNSDSTFTVWIFPAFQPNNVAVYGGEFIYTIDPDGNSLLADNSYFQGRFLGFEVNEPREIWLDYSELEKPSLGGVFFVEYYKEYFTSIYIDTKKNSSTLFRNETNGYYWVTVVKDSGKKKKKEK